MAWRRINLRLVFRPNPTVTVPCEHRLYFCGVYWRAQSSLFFFSKLLFARQLTQRKGSLRLQGSVLISVHISDYSVHNQRPVCFLVRYQVPFRIRISHWLMIIPLDWSVCFISNLFMSSQTGMGKVLLLLNIKKANLFLKSLNLLERYVFFMQFTSV